jgi:lipopolysaccharide transport system ATP-binding protein
MKPCIHVENLYKRYRIGAAPRRGVRSNLTEALTAGMKSIWRNVSGKANREANTFFALSDVSFEVRPGEVLGIIGRNGAGKSTLLKILSRIVEPTSGRATYRGRMGSLLEVGTGFHPELTGRENIYLNGSILGMSRKEIDRKFDEIVEFAEVERFLDTPVKRYSSGMHVRLGFAVAAHLQPEILVVDEVLAVGDAAFQEKCLGKLKARGREGRTVLFVSHNMVAVRQLCHSCIWLDGGRIKQIGPAADVVAAYSRKSEQAAEGTFSQNNVQGDGRVELLSYHVAGCSNGSDALPLTNEDLTITVRVRAKETLRQPACGVSITNEHGVLMTCINTVEQGVMLDPLPAGETDVSIRLRKVAFLPGRYTASFWVMNPHSHIYAMAEDAISFEIGQGAVYGTREIDHRWGCVYTKVDFEWEPQQNACAVTELRRGAHGICQQGS